MISTRQIFGLAKHAPGGPLDVDDLREMAASISGNASISALTDDQRLELCQRLDKKFVPRPVHISKPSQRRKSRLPAELFAAADKIYRMDTVKYARIAAWIYAAQKKFGVRNEDVLNALQRFKRHPSKESWWPYLNKILSMVLIHRREKEDEVFKRRELADKNPLRRLAAAMEKRSMG